ncbi:hypothetical protein [Paenibacillus sp.]|uniref:hypothetical protein n=1 Tax=Paenibacillus sp. TaxID=58172 RepID=UPI002D2AA956|nr:hypothetical protein [Paenibacillus sp.]HZG57670.1 hypothetical protein [Paenibacillus sp.]
MAKHIQAYFRTEDDAVAAVTDLQALGAIEVTSDRTAEDVGHFPAEMAAVIPALPLQQGTLVGSAYNGQMNNVLLGALVLNRDLLPGDPERSGDEGEPVVTAVVEDHMYEKAVEIVKRRGGQVE